MRKQITVLSIPIDVITMEQAVARIQAMFQESGLHAIATANAEMVMQAQEDKELKDMLHRAALVLPDGAGILWAAEQKGERFPERVAGCDLAKRLFEEAARHHTPIYCLGAAPGVVEQAIANLEGEIGRLNVVGKHSGFFDEAEEYAIIREIESTGAKLVFVALGVPKQEKWIVNRLSHLNGVVAMGIGGSFDVFAGTVQRAPAWMQRNRLEWLYRLLRQPQRFMRMMALPKFVMAVKNDKK